MEGRLGEPNCAMSRLPGFGEGAGTGDGLLPDFCGVALSAPEVCMPCNFAKLVLSAGSDDDATATCTRSGCRVGGKGPAPFCCDEEGSNGVEI